jgi:hypothetical protein
MAFQKYLETPHDGGWTVQQTWRTSEERPGPDGFDRVAVRGNERIEQGARTFEQFLRDLARGGNPSGEPSSPVPFISGPGPGPRPASAPAAGPRSQPVGVPPSPKGKAKRSKPPLPPQRSLFGDEL